MAIFCVMYIVTVLQIECRKNWAKLVLKVETKTELVKTAENEACHLLDTLLDAMFASVDYNMCLTKE